MSSDNAPLSQLAQSLMDGDSAYSMDHSTHAHSGHAAQAHAGHESSHASHSAHGSSHGWWSFVFYFLLVAVIFYFLYFALRPSFVLKQNHCDDSYSRSYSDEQYEDEIDNGRLLAAAVVSALLLIFVLWLFAWGFSGSW